MKRCNWASSEILIEYHDNRWGKPIFNDMELFKLLCLESFQAGLSWEIVLKKEKALLNVFENFNPYIVANYNENKIKNIISNPEIIRNKLKINAMVNNSKLFIYYFHKENSFSDFIWSHSDYKIIDNKLSLNDIMPTTSSIAILISKKLKEMGFKFIGEKIVYSFLEAMGFYNNHVVECFCYKKYKNKEVLK